MSRRVSTFCVICISAFAADFTAAEETSKKPGAIKKAVKANYALLVITNETNCPVEVSIDGETIGTCESYATMRVRARRTGEVTLFGRCYCDTWGPVTRTLKTGSISKWKITEVERITGPAPYDGRPVQPHAPVVTVPQPAMLQAPVTKRRIS